MNIWILWWTGRTGKTLRTHFLNTWNAVISLIRHPEKFIAESEKDTFIIWSATNSSDITVLITQIDILIDATSVWFFHKKPTSLYSSVAQAIVNARLAWKNQHIIVMSSAWTHHGRTLPRPANQGYEYFLWDVANDKEKAEAILEASALPRTIIKSPLLTNWPAKKYSIQDFETYRPSLFDTISRESLGDVVSEIIENQKKWNHKKIVAC
jgi:nucleoside-diphosphate-sugar epimerase